MVTETHDMTTSISAEGILRILDSVMDPEIPVLSVTDLGIIRSVKFEELENTEGVWRIAITPTYSGCPAMDAISMNIRLALLQHGIKNFKIEQQLSPAWTTDWISEKGKQQLLAYGIAPPVGKIDLTENIEQPKVQCPLCHSTNTKLISQFGSTSCKALYQCNDCKEPFDYFKCH